MQPLMLLIGGLVIATLIIRGSIAFYADFKKSRTQTTNKQHRRR